MRGWSLRSIPLAVLLLVVVAQVAEAHRPDATHSQQDSPTLLGKWSCQSAEGRARLEFVSEEELRFNGEASYYQLRPGVVRVWEDWGPADYRYRLEGDRLSVTGPDGSALQCERPSQPALDTRSPAGGTGMEHLLQGEKCAYSSSPDGGYSTTRRIYFDGQGRFAYTSLGEVDIPEVIGYGQAAGDPGSYRVMGVERGAEVHLTFDSGEQVVVYVHHLYQGTIMELWYEGQVYAPGLCPG